jgi:hypothetical protein
VDRRLAASVTLIEAARTQRSTTMPKTYTITLSAEQLATIQTALANEAEHCNDAGKDSEDHDESVRMFRLSFRYETLWQQLSRKGHDPDPERPDPLYDVATQLHNARVAARTAR